MVEQQLTDLRVSIVEYRKIIEQIERMPDSTASATGAGASTESSGTYPELIVRIVRDAKRPVSLAEITERAAVIKGRRASDRQFKETIRKAFYRDSVKSAVRRRADGTYEPVAENLDLMSNSEPKDIHT
jgi:hypothetical protein